MTNRYDVAVIGSGPGGYVAAIRAAQLGLKTACVEKRKTLGGTCLNIGCIPSKALLHSTEYYSTLKNHGEEHGIAFKDLSMDFDKMMNRKEQVVNGLVHGVAAAFKKYGVTHIQGTASFSSPAQIEVVHEGESTVVEGTNFIIATGSEPIPLPFLPFDEKRVVSSTGALSLPRVPQKMIVIGAGAIGLELASVYNRLGAQVAIYEMLDKITPAMDDSIGKMLMQILKKQGLEFHLGSKVVSGKAGKEGVQLEVSVQGNTQKVDGDVLLVAVGRRPYTEGLNLSAAGLELTQKGFLSVDGAFRTTQPHIFAIGDLIEGPMLAHKASEEGIAVAEVIAGKNPHVNYLSIPNVIYTHPEVASVGYTEQEAVALKLEILVGTCAFKANGRARCMGATDGMVKVIGEKKSGRLIGMHIVGPNASEMIAEGVVALENKMTLEQLARVSHAHPTLNEATLEATLNALGRAIHY